MTAPAPRGGVTEARNPDGYAYRYETYDGSVIRFNGGTEVNGSKPTEAIPYYLVTPPAAQAQDARPMATAEDYERVIDEMAARTTSAKQPGYGATRLALSVIKVRAAEAATARFVAAKEAK